MVRHFPKGFTPNVNQKLALERIDEAFNNGVKFVVVQGPTGCGKSYIAKAVANSTSTIPQVLRDRINDYSAYSVKWSNGEFDYEYADEFNEKGYGASILTTTKNLQDQYERDFKDIESLKGKNSYICNLNNRDTADNAPCAVSTNVKRACWDCKQCDYYEQRNKSISSKISIENYSSFFHKPDHLKNREIIICDEASELEDVIVSRFSCILEHGKLRKHDLSIRYTDNRKVFKERLLDLYEDVKMKYDQARKIITTHENNQKDIVPTVKDSTRQSYKFLGDLKNSLKLVVETWTQSKYIIDKDVDNGRSCIKLIPRKVDVLAQHLFRYADKVLLLSATFVDYKRYMRSLGVEQDNYTFIDLPSSFDSKKSPIRLMPLSINRKNIERMFPTVVERINYILNLHKHDKGMIHTQSNAITNMLYDRITDKRLLYRIKGEASNMDILEEHVRRKDPTVLVSPSMSFGVDLKGDLGTFCIVVKTPWPDLGSPRIKAMTEVDGKWYNNKMFSTLIQQCGRCTRDVNDVSTTYIIDGGHILKLINEQNYRELLPKYFTDRFRD